MAVAVSAIGLWRGGPEIAAVVSSTMILIVMAGSLIGMSIPFVLSRLRYDAGTASAPLITSIAGATGVVIYFAIATAVLPIPQEAETLSRRPSAGGTPGAAGDGGRTTRRWLYLVRMSLPCRVIRRV